ncbi:Hsp20/alpha crystallin family protein [Microvirga sp. M2]|uniref:Hsp20/alpha crystallin family protein n=1 Tax=Microvirga sp. M2 TaxID=3073270 RepID=UPI0039C1E8B9
MERLFDEFGRGLGFPARWSMSEIEPFWRTRGRGIAPVVDLVEKPDRYEVTAELPGMDEKNIEVKLSNGSLVISGEKKEEKEGKEANYFMTERRYGSFQRAIRLPEGVNADKIEASFKNGVLAVILPKTEEAKTETKINVKAA